MELLPYVLLAVMAFFAWMQLRVVFAAKGQQGKLAPRIDDLLDERQRGQDPLMLYFFSEHCGPCRATTPLVERLAQNRSNLIKIDVGRQPEVARRFGVVATPTFVLIRQGRLAKVVLGALKEKKLLSLLDESVESR